MERPQHRSEHLHRHSELHHFDLALCLAAPDYGVGTKTALITCAFGIAWMVSMFINLTNLGLLPPRLALLEAIFETIEFPIAMIVGAGVYEGKEKEIRESE